MYERAVEYFGDHNMDEKLFIAFARFEENQREVGHLVSVYILDTVNDNCLCNILQNISIVT